MHGVNPLCIAAQSSRFTSSHQVVGQRTESDRAADGIRSGGERNPIGRRTESGRGCSCLSCTNQASGESIPTEYAEHTEPSGGDVPPTDCTDFHRLGEYGIPVTPTQPIAHPNFCGFREFRGRFFSASNSVRSVDSVGDSSQQVILWIPWIPWEILLSK